MLSDSGVSEIIDKIKLSPDMVGADFGTGSGRWALELSRRLLKGLVYAIDIQEECLSALEGRAKQEYLDNIRLLRRDLSVKKGSGLPDLSVNVVFLANALSQMEGHRQVIEEAYRVLKPKGSLLVIDWQKDSPLTSCLSLVESEDVELLAEKIGFRLVESVEVDEYHFGLIFKK
jgi:ubiquinone/menaquinone biosynthesis C-methylase UbiE